ncbi:MAG: hypothetical protein K1W19_03225 [Lachnospiraceae bacterium]
MVQIANSTLVTDLKSAVIKEIINDETLFYAINSNEIKDIKQANKLVYKHIFPYHQNPETIKETNTFLTIQVHVPKPYSYMRSKAWVAPNLEIWIFSHHDHMRVDNIPKISDNRNDYISKLLDEKFNGRRTLGGNKNEEHNLHLYGQLDLVANVEGAFTKDYLYRQMIFETTDLNRSLCEEE